MGWVSFVSYTKKNERDISRTHWVANSKRVRIVLDNMSSAIIVFICKTKAVQYSHELTWRYWHIHVAPCHSMVQRVLINIVLWWLLQFFPNFKENKDFSKFSSNYVDLAHAIAYVSVADDVVKCNHSDDRLFCLIQKCGFFLFKVIIFKYWHILCGTTGHSVPLHRLYLTCVVISGPGLESNQDTKYLSVTTRNCRSVIY